MRPTTPKLPTGILLPLRPVRRFYARRALPSRIIGFTLHFDKVGRLLDNGVLLLPQLVLLQVPTHLLIVVDRRRRTRQGRIALLCTLRLIVQILLLHVVIHHSDLVSCSLHLVQLPMRLVHAVVGQRVSNALEVLVL